MNEHVVATIHDIDHKIHLLATLREGLLVLFAPTQSPVLAACSPLQCGDAAPKRQNPAAKKPAKRPNVVTARIPAAKSKPVARKSLLLDRSARIACIPEPFTAPDIANHCHIDNVSASNWITHAKAKAWVKRVGAGQYVRTAKFPAAGSAPSASTKSTVRAASAPAAPRPGVSTADRSDLQRKLDDAVKQRDYARENGRTEVVAIFQKEIDSITAQLGE